LRAKNSSLAHLMGPAPIKEMYTSSYGLLIYNDIIIFIISHHASYHQHIGIFIVIFITSIIIIIINIIIIIIAITLLLAPVASHYLTLLS